MKVDCKRLIKFRKLPTNIVRDEMKKQFVLLAITLLLCLQGCGIPYYFPTLSRHIELRNVRTSRGEIDNFLEIGKTSMEEIQSTWGYPFQIQDSRNIWVYIGLKTTGYIGFIGIDSTITGIEPIEKGFLLLIKFDKNDCLKRYELKEVAINFVRGDDVRPQAIKWDNSFEVQSK
jgi:hypothetical protein